MLKNISKTQYSIVFIIFLATILCVALTLHRISTPKTEISTGKIPGDNAQGTILKGLNTSERKNHLKTNDSVTYQSEILDTHKPQTNAAILQWNQRDNSGEVLAGFRVFNGESWSRWVESSPQEDRKDGTSAPHAALVIGDGIEKIQYRFELIADATLNTSPEIDLSSTSIELVDTTKGPSPTKQAHSIQNILEKVGLINTAQAHSDDPRIISRAEWGAPEPNSSDRWTPEYRKLEHVIVHHTAVASQGDSAASVRAIWYYHANSLAWGDIGYNYLVDTSGNIFEGRYSNKEYAEKNSVDVVGGHAYSYNYGSSGIAALGDFTNTQPTSSMLNSIGALAAYKLYRYGVSPNDWRGGIPVIVGHRDVIQTSCPGTIHNHLATLRSIASTEYNHYSSRPFVPQNYEVVKGMDSPTVYVSIDNELRPLSSAGQRDCFIMAYTGRMRSVSETNIASLNIGSSAGVCSPPNYTWFYPEYSQQQYVLLYGGMYPAGYNDVVVMGGANKARPLSDVGIQYLYDTYVSPSIPDNILIKGAGQAAVYEADNDTLQHVTNPDSRDCLISQIGAVKNVPDSLVAAYQSNNKIISGSATCTITKGQIMNPDGMSVAQVVSGSRRYVSNPAIRDCIISKTNSGTPYKVSQTVWDSFSTGSNAYCPYGAEIRFVKEASNPAVWRVFSDGRKQHADGFCVVDPWTTPLNQYHVWIVPDGETAGHVYDGVFAATPENCAAIT